MGSGWLEGKEGDAEVGEKYVDELRVKQVNKLIETVKLVSIEVSAIVVQTDVLVPVVPVVVKEPVRALYTSMAIHASVEVAALAPVSTVLPLIGTRALVVYEVSC